MCVRLSFEQLLIVLVQPLFEKWGVARGVLHVAGMAAGAEEFPAGVGEAVGHGFCDVGCAEVITAADNECGFADGSQFVSDIIIF